MEGMTTLVELINPLCCCCNSTPSRLAARQLPTASFHSREFLFRRRDLRVPDIAPAKNVPRLATTPSLGSRVMAASPAGVPVPPLDLTEENIKEVLVDARIEESTVKVKFLFKDKKLKRRTDDCPLLSLQLAQLFDSSVGITGVAELAEMDGPFVKIKLRGRFWHERSVVLARVGNYLKQRIPEILEVDVEDEKMLDDSPENF
ncbi:hypothetical protein SAY87_008054 [Trapa incisa]|uniref:Uncharacterized protein n=1 Tax=Trapa incisa TaxID=236973 RepID=A0AAN7QFN8_9MYRT|nr:hypothetical protein SAY87_008054 [Trapa incisa]